MKRSAYLGWAIGSFTSAALVGSVGLLHLRFMTDSLGLAIGLAGTLTVLSKVYDAATDPVMGHIADHTRTRWGQYRPYLLAGGLLAGISLVMLFNVPAALKGGALVGYVALSLLIFSTAYTVFRIPYLALGRAITQNFDERSRLMTFSVYGSSLGSLAATSAAPFLLSRIGSDRAGHGLVAIILAMLVAIGGAVTFTLLREAKQADHERSHQPGAIGGTWKTLRENRPFLCLIGFKVAIFSGMTLHLAAMPFFTRHVLGVSDGTLGSIFLGQTLAMMASQYIWVRVARRFGRRNSLITAALLSVINMFSWFLVPAVSPTPWVQIIGVNSGIASGGVFLGLYTVLTDTMDYSRHTQGEDRAGLLAGIFVMVEKITAAFGTFVFSVILSLFGFVSATDAGAAAQSPQVRLAIVIALSLVPAALALVACTFMLRYRLPSENEILAREDARKLVQQPG